MQVENVTGIRLASGRTTQGQRHLAIRDSLLGQVVVDAQHVTAGVVRTGRLAVLAVVHEELAHCGTGHRRDVLQRSGIGCRGGHDDRVIHGTVAVKRFDDLRDRGGLLADGHVDADHVLTLLIDDGIDGDSGLTGLAVADDELALTAADRDHRVDSQDAGLHRLAYGLTGDNAGGLELDGTISLGRNGALTIDRHAERVHNAAEHALANRHFNDTTSGLDLVVFFDCGDIAEKNGADFVLFEVLSQTVHGLTAFAHEFEQLAGHGIFQAIDTCDTVANLDDGTDFARLNARIEGIELLAQRSLNRLCGDFSH